MKTETINLYRRFRAASPVMLVGRNAECALHAAKTIQRFRELEADGLVRLLVVDDCDADVSWMDDEQRKEWDGTSYGTITEYWSGKNGLGEWLHADSCFGHIGYKDPGDPFENPYVVDEMAEAVRLATQS